ncbi:hypothetical protein A1D26_01550 [Ursidibacter maritimus]|nr:hypothetical protein A1D26_01550 [Ursidibacter maritimus]
MKKIVLWSALIVAISACSTNKPVEVVKAKDQSATVISQQAIQQSQIPLNVPANATALCRDGTYSTAKENTCSGNGGTMMIIDRYRAE